MTRLIILLLLLFPIAVLAQDEESTVLVPDEPQTLSIIAHNRAGISFNVVDSDVYVHLYAEGETEELDPVVWIVDSNKRLIAYNDNADETGRAEIDNLYLSPDSYTVFVDSFNGVTEGDVILLLEIVDPFQIDVISRETEIVINAFLPEDAIFSYEFSANTDDLVTVTVRDISGSLDPYLTVYDEIGNLLIANDDHQSTDLSLNLFDSRVSGWAVPEDASYTVTIHDFSGNSGQFELSLTFHP